MSQALVWELVKNTNAFRVQKAGQVWTLDRYSNTGKNTYSGLGFIQNKAVAIEAGKKAGQFEVRNTKRQRFPRNNKKEAKNVNKDAKTNFYEEHLPVSHGVHTVSKVIRKRYAHRAGLQKQALRKLVQLNKAGFRQRNNQLKEQKEKK